MSDGVTLGDLQGAYKRVTARIYRLLEDGYDFAVEEKIIATLDLDALIVDAAFFVLIFGQIENRVNELAVRRIGADRRRAEALREARFDRRLNSALPGSGNKSPRDEIAGWYNIRRGPAHGERFAASYNVATVFERAFQLEALVDEQLSQAGHQGMQRE